MTQTRTCGKCDLYSYQLTRCKRGWTNPRTLKGTVDAMRFMGVSYICPYSKWRDKAIKKVID